MAIFTTSLKWHKNWIYRGMKTTSFKFRDYVLLAGVIVAILIGVYTAYSSFKNPPVTQPAQQESNLSNETTGSLTSGVFTLVFKNGLELIRVIRDSK